jgi:hypothetical protein
MLDNDFFLCCSACRISRCVNLSAARALQVGMALPPDDDKRCRHTRNPWAGERSTAQHRISRRRGRNQKGNSGTLCAGSESRPVHCPSNGLADVRTCISYSVGSIRDSGTRTPRPDRNSHAPSLRLQRRFHGREEATPHPGSKDSGCFA